MRLRLLALCAAVLVVLFGARPAAAGPQDKRLDIYWVDVEGGAATLIVTPAGETLLIDSGNPGRRDADRIAQAVTKIAGMRQVDHLITTHFHGDHFGGAATLSTQIPIRNVYDNAEFPEQKERPDKAYLEFKCEKRVQLNPGDSLPVKQAADGAPALKIACLGTRQQFIAPIATSTDNASVCADARMKDRDGSDNANSVVLLMSFGGFKFFDAGDLTWNQEARLVCPKNLVGTVDVYQVTHHGLDASNNPLVVRTIQPRVAIMNNGATKGCAPEVFETLKTTKSIEAIYQVHKNQRPDGATNNVIDEYIANPDAKECKGNYIKLSVAPDAKSYTVSVPATKHERTFTVK